MNAYKRDHYFRLTSSLFKTLAIAIILSTSFPMDSGKQFVGAQESSTNSIQTWRDAAKLLDSLSDEEAKRGEVWLRQELAKKETPVEAAWTLALFCVKKRDLPAVDRVIKAISQRYPDLPLPVAIAVERMRLSVALAQDDAATAEAAMKKLIHVTAGDQIAKEDSQLNAASIGTLLGMLEAESAQSPIATATLNTAKQTLASMKKDSISTQFGLAYESAKTQANALTAKFEAVKASGIEPIKAEQQSLIKEHEALNVSVEEAEEAMRLTKRNTDEQSKANRISIKRIQDFVAKLRRDWKTPTPGHPGLEPRAPVKPSKSAIQVDEYETKYDTTTVTDADGNRVQKRTSKQVRRPQSEIDRERDFKYAQLMEVYRRVKAEYDVKIVKYRDMLATWIQTDRDRREKMKKEEQESLEKAAELEKQIDSLDEERVAAAKNVTILRSELKQLQRECETIAEVLRASESQKPESSFRPGFFETVFVDQEKARLLKLR